MTTSHTPGPWRWELHKDGKQLTLCGTGTCGSYDFYVMDFERWGMSGATPRFRSGDDNTMCKAVEFGEIVKGREHHAHWFQNINHPDARLIAASPTLLKELQNLVSNWRKVDIRLLDIENAEAAIKRALGGTEA